MERELKAKGMDVDVQRYYLIQIPLRRDVRGIQLSNMGTPPSQRPMPMPRTPESEADYVNARRRAPSTSPRKGRPNREAERAEPGLGKVAIGHGEVEGAYFAGSGYQGARAEEPIRVTVVYFVTPVGRITEQGHGHLRQGLLPVGLPGHLGRQLRDQGNQLSHGFVRTDYH